jgi:hypothetical protein
VLCSGQTTATGNLRANTPRLPVYMPAQIMTRAAVRAMSNLAAEVLNIYAAIRTAAGGKITPYLRVGVSGKTALAVSSPSIPAWYMRLGGAALAALRVHTSYLGKTAVSAATTANLQGAADMFIKAPLAAINVLQSALGANVPQLSIAVAARTAVLAAGRTIIELTAGLLGSVDTQVQSRGRWSALRLMSGTAGFMGQLWGKSRYPLRVSGGARTRVAETGSPRLQLTITKAKATSQTFGGARFTGLAHLKGIVLTAVKTKETPKLHVFLSGRAGSTVQVSNYWRVLVRLTGKTRTKLIAGLAVTGKIVVGAKVHAALRTIAAPGLRLRNLAGRTAGVLESRTGGFWSFLSGRAGHSAKGRGLTVTFKLGQPVPKYTMLSPRHYWVMSMQKGATELSACPDLLPPIDAGVEQAIVKFDFSNRLALGVFIVSAAVTISVESGSGTDATPALRLIGGPTLISSPYTGEPRTAVSQMVGNCVADIFYQLQCVATTSDGQSLSLWGRLPCASPE